MKDGFKFFKENFNHNFYFVEVFYYLNVNFSNLYSV